MKSQYEYNLSKLVPWVYEDEGGLLGVPRPGTEEAAAPGWSSAQRRKRGRNEADARDEAVRVCQQWPVTTPRPPSRPPGRAARRPRVSSPRPGAAPHRSTACDCSVSVISMPHGLWSSYRLMRITNYRVFGSRRDARAHTCAAGAGPAGTKKRASTHYTPRAETGTAISAQAGHLTRSTHAHEHGPTFRHPTPHARPAETPGSAGSRRFICNCILARDGGTLHHHLVSNEPPVNLKHRSDLRGGQTGWVGVGASGVHYLLHPVGASGPSKWQEATRTARARCGS